MTGAINSRLSNWIDKVNHFDQCTAAAIHSPMCECMWWMCCHFSLVQGVLPKTHDAMKGKHKAVT